MTKKQFAKKFTAWRKLRGAELDLGRSISQAEASAELGIPKRTLQGWEIARTIPNGFGLAAVLAVIDQPRGNAGQ